MSDIRIQLSGQTEYHNGSYEMIHRETILIEPDRVQSSIAGMGPGCEVVDPVASDDPAVIAYERRKVQAREISAYRNRPITPIFKPERKRKAKRSVTPDTQGSGE